MLVLGAGLSRCNHIAHDYVVLVFKPILYCIVANDIDVSSFPFSPPRSTTRRPFCRSLSVGCESSLVEGYSRSKHSGDIGGRRQRGQRMNFVGGKDDSEDITTYERPECIVQRERSTCDKKLYQPRLHSGRTCSAHCQAEPVIANAKLAQADTIQKTLVLHSTVQILYQTLSSKPRRVRTVIKGSRCRIRTWP